MAYFLGSLQAFIGVTAIVGGLRLVSNPNGVPDFPIEWLTHSPFTSYFIPGLALLTIIGLGNVFAGAVTFLRKGYSGNVAALFGIFLIFYMTVEIWFVGLRNFLQPLYFVLGTMVLVIGLKLFKLNVMVHRVKVESTPD